MQLTYDPRYPGAMIPDAAGWARIITFFAAVITGFLGALVGIAVGLARVGTSGGAVIGVSAGVGLFLVFTIWDFSSYWSSLEQEPSHVSSILLSHLAIFFVAFVLGLPLVGLVTGFINSKLSG
jgi:ABC-type amino acid transport system permease subunit